MTLALADRWVWDSWIAQDGDEYHLFFLQAPKALVDPELRHRNATIGHAVSRDLVDWTVIDTALEPGAPGDPDETATWTGSVVRHPDGTWRMFYTGARFLSDGQPANIETVASAWSLDLRTWTKLPVSSFGADPRWYEILANLTWREEAWRDPWVFRDPDGLGWHMLLTARANHGMQEDRGVLGHAWSPDLETWSVLPPLSAPGEGFAHIEVPQVVQIDGHWVLVFSCDSAHLVGRRAGQPGGIWAVRIRDPRSPVGFEAAVRLTGDEFYAGRAVQTPGGDWALLAFTNHIRSGDFVGQVTDPIPLSWSPSGTLTAHIPEVLR